MLTLAEYLEDYASDELKRKGNERISALMQQLEDDATREAFAKKLDQIRQGERDLYF